MQTFPTNRTAIAVWLAAALWTVFPTDAGAASMKKLRYLEKIAAYRARMIGQPCREKLAEDKARAAQHGEEPAGEAVAEQPVDQAAAKTLNVGVDPTRLEDQPETGTANDETDQAE